MQQIWIAEYLMALIAQLFLYCWHSNDVLYLVSILQHFYFVLSSGFFILDVILVMEIVRFSSFLTL